MTTASKEAYVAIVDKLPSKRATIYRVIREHAIIVPYLGLTIREAMSALGWPHTTVSARIFELAEAGLIKASGEFRQGQTVWTYAQPDEVEGLSAARAASKRYETGVVSFHGVGGPESFGPEQMMSVEVQVPRKIWQTFKGPIRVRFL